MDLRINSVLEEVRDNLIANKKDVLWSVAPLPSFVIALYVILWIAYGTERQNISGLGFLHILTLFLLAGFLFLKTISFLHRLFIFHESPKLIALVEWRRSDTLLLKSGAKIFGLYIISSILFLKFISSGFESENDTTINQISVVLFTIAFQLLLMAVATRILLVFPASAAHVEMSIRGAWKRTQNYKWNLLVLLGIIPTATSILFAILPEFNSAVYQFLLLFFWIVVWIFELAILSICFKRLTASSLGDDESLQHT